MRFRAFWRRYYRPGYAGTAVLVVLALVGVGLTVNAILGLPANAGWDLQIVCAARTTMRQGQDPYILGDLVAAPFSYPYLPYVALLVGPVCTLGPPHSQLFAWVFNAILVVAAGFLVRRLGGRWRQAALVGLAVPAMFRIGAKLALTGNPAICEVPLMVAAVLAWHRGRPAVAGGVLGALATFKFLPLLDLAVFPLLMPARTWRRPVWVGLVVFTLILGLSLLCMEGWRLSFWRELMGTLPNQHTPMTEIPTPESNPAFPGFLAALCGAVGVPQTTPGVTLVALLYLGLGTWLTRLARAVAGAETAEWRTRLFCLALLALNLAFFRLKPYAYAALVPLAVAACLGLNGRLRVWLFALVLLSRMWVRPLALLPAVGPVLHDYGQLVSLLIAFATLAVVTQWDATAPDVAGWWRRVRAIW